MPQRTRRIALTILLLVVLLAFSAGAVAAEETATITDATPSECTQLNGGSQTFDLAVQYDLKGQQPGYMSIVVHKDRYGDVDKKVDLSGYSSSDTVQASITENINSDWEEAVVDVTVFPEDGSATSASDQVRYPVSGPSECGTDSGSSEESLSGVVEEAEGSLPHGFVLAERLSDDETKLKEWDSDGTFQFTDPYFVEPGDYRVHAYTEDGTIYWGYVEEHIDEGESAYVNVPRGGVYEKKTRISGEGSDSDSRFAPGESIQVSMDVQRPRHGNEVEIESYIYPVDGSRSDNPTAVYDHGYIGSGPSTLDFNVEAPAEEGKYRIDFVVKTGFDIHSERVTTSIVDGKSITVDSYEPPSIASHSPNESTTAVGTDDTQQFTVTIDDEDTKNSGVETRWYVDDQQVATGRSFSFDASKYGGGTHDVVVVADDGSSRTQNDRFAWSVEVIEPPVIETVEPGNVEVSAGESVDFTASASDPAGYTPITYSWTIAGTSFTGESVSTSFERAGTKSIRVTATNDRGISATRTFEVDVSAPPRIIEQSPESENIGLLSGQVETFSLEATDPDGTTISYEWFVEGERMTTGPTFQHKFTEAGSYNVKAIATDVEGSKSSRSWSVTVDRFRNGLVIDPHVTGERLTEEGRSEFMTVSIQNPSANRRTANVDIIVQPPPGILVSSTHNVREGSASQYIGYARVSPNSETSIRVYMELGDESMKGESVEVPYRVLYYPEGNSQDTKVVRSDEINLVLGESPATTNRSDSDNGAPEVRRDGSGFQFSVAVVALLAVILLARRINRSNAL